MMVKIVEIFGKPYTIELKTKMSDYGECKNGDCIIEINSNQCLAQLRDTLLHEVIHAIEIELALAMNEKQVRLVATGLLSVLRRNPEFVAYLTAD